MLGEIPNSLKKAVQDTLKAEREKGENGLRDRVKSLELDILDLSYQLGEANTATHDSLLDILALIEWALDSGANPADIIGKISTETTQIMSDINLARANRPKEKPNKPLSLFDFGSIIERGKCLDLDTPDTQNGEKS